MRDGPVRDGLGRARVLVVALVVAAGGVAARPATASADTLVGCNTGGLVVAVNAAVTAGSGTLDLTPGCTYKLTSADPSGYGLPNISGSVTIHGNGATIKRVAAAPQFGLVNVLGTLVMDHVTLTGGNTTNYGGAIRAIGASSVTLVDSTVSGNTAVLGGGIFFNTGTYFVTRSTISENTATSGGGGIYNNGGTETITNSTISGNTDTGGGGGGIYNVDNASTITSSTISGNSAAGIYNAFDSGGSLTTAGTILSGNTGGNCSIPQGPFTSGGYNLASDATCALTGATDMSSADPLLGALQGNGGPTETMAPGPTSPAVDAIPVGANGCGSSLKTDQRGVARAQGAGCDIGAYETGDVAMQALKATPKTVKSGANVTYVATVVSAGAIDATGVAVVDKLPTGLSFVSAQASQGGCSFVAPNVACSLGQFPAATTATVTIVAKVTAGPLTAITDKVTVIAATGNTMLTNDAKTAKIKVK